MGIERSNKPKSEDNVSYLTNTPRIKDLSDHLLELHAIDSYAQKIVIRSPELYKNSRWEVKFYKVGSDEETGAPLVTAITAHIMGDKVISEEVSYVYKGQVIDVGPLGRELKIHAQSVQRLADGVLVKLQFGKTTAASPALQCEIVPINA